MNYAVVVAAFIGIFSVGWWFAGARKTYVGPRTKDLVTVGETSGEDDEAAEREE